MQATKGTIHIYTDISTVVQNMQQRGEVFVVTLTHNIESKVGRKSYFLLLRSSERDCRSTTGVDTASPLLSSPLLYCKVSPDAGPEQSSSHLPPPATCRSSPFSCCCSCSCSGLLLVCCCCWSSEEALSATSPRAGAKRSMGSESAILPGLQWGAVVEPPCAASRRRRQPWSAPCRAPLLMLLTWSKRLMRQQTGC
jgi:hypothetical protein